MEFEKDLIELAENTLKEIKRPEIEKIMSKEAVKNNAKENEKVQTEKVQTKNELLQQVFEHLM